MSNEPVSPPDYRHDTVLPLPPEVRADAWAVDAACPEPRTDGISVHRPGHRGAGLPLRPRPWHQQYRRVPCHVHALALMDQQGIHDKAIYSDSYNAILWVRNKHCKTKLLRDDSTAKAYELVARAERWLATHPAAVPIIKWETKKWGEIPADFGNKKK